MAKKFYEQLGTGVASLAFGVALSVFIFAAATGVAATVAAWLLFLTSFLLMMRFWWRYTELFIRRLPSHTFWQFLFDFATSFFGIITVLFVGDLQMWAAVGAAAMISSLARSSLSWREAKKSRPELKKTVWGALGMLVLFAAVYAAAPLVSALHLSAVVFVIVLVFVICASRK